MVDEVSSSNDDFGLLLTLASVTFMDELEAVMEEAGHPASQGWFGFVLRALEARPLSLRELADRLEMSSPGALKVVDPLVAAGYLERRESPTDRRVRTIGLTVRGQGALELARSFHRRFEAELVDQLGADVVGSARVALVAIVDRGSGRVPRLFRGP